MYSLKDIELFLIDLDGTIYIDDELISGAKEKLQEIKDKGKRFCFLTNNSSRSRIQYLDKLRQKGINITEDEMFSSVDSTVYFLKKNYPNEKVYVVGTQAFIDELKKSGVNVRDYSGELDGEIPDVVVLAFDTTLSYEKLVRITTYISRGATYIATHPDDICPSKPCFIPDVGSFIELIYTVTKIRPHFICGKPTEIMGQAIRDKFDISSNKIAMIGDRLNTDIAFAINNNFMSVLVFSGETDREMYKNTEYKAKITLNSIADMEI